MNDAEKWSQYCRMTCLGGSERGTCSCTHPDQCELRDDPSYQHHRNEANEKMVRITLSDLDTWRTDDVIVQDGDLELAEQDAELRDEAIVASASSRCEWVWRAGKLDDHEWPADGTHCSLSSGHEGDCQFRCRDGIRRRLGFR